MKVSPSYIFDSPTDDKAPETSNRLNEELLKYMENEEFKTGYKTGSRIIDPYTESFVDIGTVFAFTDGEWYWTSKDIFLVFRHFANPKKSFVDKAMNSISPKNV